jgi:hypothetical protein
MTTETATAAPATACAHRRCGRPTSIVARGGHDHGLRHTS